MKTRIFATVFTAFLATLPPVSALGATKIEGSAFAEKGVSVPLLRARLIEELLAKALTHQPHYIESSVELSNDRIVKTMDYNMGSSIIEMTSLHEELESKNGGYELKISFIPRISLNHVLNDRLAENGGRLSRASPFVTIGIQPSDVQKSTLAAIEIERHVTQTVLPMIQQAGELVVRDPYALTLPNGQKRFVVEYYWNIDPGRLSKILSGSVNIESHQRFRDYIAVSESAQTTPTQLTAFYQLLEYPLSLKLTVGEKRVVVPILETIPCNLSCNSNPHGLLRINSTLGSPARPERLYFDMPLDAAMQQNRLISISYVINQQGTLQNE